jgi:diguanylate cyclase
MVNIVPWLPSFTAMTDDRSSPNPRRAGWRDLLGLAPRREAADQPMRYDPAAADAPRPDPLETAMPARRRMLAQVADFLIDHDLEILPFTLAIAYDCVTGGSPRLAQKIFEHTAKGQPITLKWLEEASSTQARDPAAEAVAAVVAKLEDNLSDLGQTMADVCRTTGSYSIALEGHVTDLQTLEDSADLLVQLTALTRRMLDHTRSVHGELAVSETRFGALQARLDDARRLANQDHLTGLPNRRGFDEMFERELREARLGGETLCVAFCDIDNFKRINDAHGHPAGDRVIRYVAETLGRIADARCHVARHGGEEFAVLLRGTSLTEAWARLDAAREEIARKRLVNRATDRPFGPITFSGGIADALGHRSKGAALKAADAALYAAKDAGRNRVLIAAEEPEPLRDVA